LSKKKCNKKGWCEYNNNECLAVEARCDTHSCSAGTKKSDPSSLVGDDDYTCCDGCFDDPEYFSFMGYCSSYEPGRHNDIYCELDGVLDICCAACNAIGDRGFGNYDYPIVGPQTGAYLPGAYLPGGTSPQYPIGPQTGAYLPGGTPNDALLFENCPLFAAIVGGSVYSYTTSLPSIESVCKQLKDEKDCADNPMAPQLASQLCVPDGGFYTTSDGGVFPPGFNVVPGGGVYTTPDGGVFSPGYNAGLYGGVYTTPGGGVFSPGYNVGCEEDLKECSDGTFVGRVEYENCGFAFCPEDGCSYGCPKYFIGDSMCDPMCNTEACGFDGGDCDGAGTGAGQYGGPQYYFPDQDPAAFTQTVEGGMIAAYNKPNGR